jgi:hypothetical protein
VLHSARGWFPTVAAPVKVAMDRWLLRLAGKLLREMSEAAEGTDCTYVLCLGGVNCSYLRLITARTMQEGLPRPRLREFQHGTM